MKLSRASASEKSAFMVLSGKSSDVTKSYSRSSATHARCKYLDFMDLFQGRGQGPPREFRWASSGFSREREPGGEREVHVDDNYGELAQAVTEARKSHDPPPASRRPREAGGGTSRPRAEDAMSSLGSSSGVGRGGRVLLPLPLSTSSGRWVGWSPPQWGQQPVY